MSLLLPGAPALTCCSGPQTRCTTLSPVGKASMSKLRDGPAERSRALHVRRDTCLHRVHCGRRAAPCHDGVVVVRGDGA